MIEKKSEKKKRFQKKIQFNFLIKKKRVPQPYKDGLSRYKILI